MQAHGNGHVTGAPYAAHIMGTFVPDLHTSSPGGGGTHLAAIDAVRGGVRHGVVRRAVSAIRILVGGAKVLTQAACQSWLAAAATVLRMAW